MTTRVQAVGAGGLVGLDPSTRTLYVRGDGSLPEAADAPSDDELIQREIDATPTFQLQLDPGDPTRLSPRAPQGHTFEFGPGTYCLRRGLLLRANLTLRGSGDATVLKLGDDVVARLGSRGNVPFVEDPRANVLAIQPNESDQYTQGVADPWRQIDNIVVRDLRLDGNGEGNVDLKRSHGIAIWGGRHILIENITVERTLLDGVYLGGHQFWTTNQFQHHNTTRPLTNTDVVVRSCRFNATGRCGVGLIAGEDISICDNYIRMASDAQDPERAIELSGKAGALNVEPNFPADHVQRVLIAGNLIHDCQWDGIVLNAKGDADVYRDVIIAENLVDPTHRDEFRTGIFVTTQVSAVAIAANLVTGQARHGLRVGGRRRNRAAASDLTICSNIFSTDEENAGTGLAIGDATRRAVAAGNAVTDNRAPDEQGFAEARISVTRRKLDPVDHSASYVTGQERKIEEARAEAAWLYLRRISHWRLNESERTADADNFEWRLDKPDLTRMIIIAANTCKPPPPVAAGLRVGGQIVVRGAMDVVLFANAGTEGVGRPIVDRYGDETLLPGGLVLNRRTKPRLHGVFTAFLTGVGTGSGTRGNRRASSGSSGRRLVRLPGGRLDDAPLAHLPADTSARLLVDAKVQSRFWGRRVSRREVLEPTVVVDFRNHGTSSLLLPAGPTRADLLRVQTPDDGNHNHPLPEDSNHAASDD